MTKFCGGEGVTILCAVASSFGGGVAAWLVTGSALGSTASVFTGMAVAVGILIGYHFLGKHFDALERKRKAQ